MNAFDFIIAEIRSFIHNSHKTRVRYEHDKVAKTHFIEIFPNEIYRFDESYLQWESDLFDRFIARYPAENICFISDDAIVGLDKVDFELSGKEFSDSYSVNEDKIVQISTPNVSIQQKTVSKQPELTYNNNIQQDFTPPTFQVSLTYQLAA